MPDTETLLKTVADMPTSLDDVLPSLHTVAEFNTQPFVASLAMIIISELGDKTFLVAALMAMKHDRLTVFLAAFAALLIMSVLSGLLGHTMPSLLPQWLTQTATCMLFLVFGTKMCWEGYSMSKDASVNDEMAEVEQEISTNAATHDVLHAAEGGSVVNNDDEQGQAIRMTKQSLDGIRNLSMLVFSPVFVQTFTLTFLGEWGDRSQIATIAMAAGGDYWWVIIGTVLGHSLCTALAVLGGRLLASKISIRQVTFSGGILFLIFGLVALYELIERSGGIFG